MMPRLIILHSFGVVMDSLTHGINQEGPVNVAKKEPLKRLVSC